MFIVLIICCGGMVTYTSAATVLSGADQPAARTLCIGDEASGDTDGDGLCDNLDRDDDNDGCADIIDDNPFRAGTDTDGDGLADACDLDIDNDGVKDVNDPEPYNPFICGDSDNDGCDDCSIGDDGFGSYYDIFPENDGPDADADGICDNQPCGTPENLALLSAQWFQATLGWDPVEGAERYRVEIRLEFLPYVFKRATVSTNSYQARLLPFLPYEFRVRAHCGNGWADWSGWHPFALYPFTAPAAPPSEDGPFTAFDVRMFEQNSIKVYPNPTSGLLNIEFDGRALQDVELNITDLSGRLVYREHADWMPGDKRTVDLHGLENGMYLINFLRDDVVLTSEKIFLTK